MTDNAPELHTLTGAYAVDALDDLERRRFESHLEQCASCRQEVAELAATAERLAVAAADQPPARMRDRVLAEVARTRQLPPTTEPRRRGAASTTQWYRQPTAWVAAVLLVVAVGVGGIAVSETRRADRAADQAARIAAVATDPDRVVREARATTGGTGTVLSADGTGVFRTTGLRELPSDQAYQLWVIRGTRLVSAGVLGRGGRLVKVIDDMAGADGVALTVEPADGSEQPTSDPVLRLDVA